MPASQVKAERENTLIKTIDLRNDSSMLTAGLPRAALDTGTAADTVRELIEQVRTLGLDAILELSERFDGIRPTAVRVPRDAIQVAVATMEPGLRTAFEEMIRRVRIVHRDQRRTAQVTEVVPGGTVTTRWVPVRRVGMYVPGGRALYGSTVVMSVVPAQEAEVPSIAIASPPQRTNRGLPDPTVLAVAGLLGIDEVYAVGGVQAISMLAYGVSDAEGRSVCEGVDLVTGPGNVWVATAKRLLQGVVGIDAVAGPTEIMILADDSAVPAWVAADLISQAEHDPLAASVLVTDSERLAGAVRQSLAELVPQTKHSERVRDALGGEQSAILLVSDLEDGLKVVDAYGPEHLEIHADDGRALADRVRNAGAIFVGSHTPVALGDYCAGSNHVLPTGGTARHSGGLSVQSFLRGIEIVDYDSDALAAAAGYVEALAHSEDLPAHSQSVAIRFSGR